MHKNLTVFLTLIIMSMFSTGIMAQSLTYAFDGAFFSYGTIDPATGVFTSMNFIPQGSSYYPVSGDNDGTDGQFAVMADFSLSGYYLWHINFINLTSDSIAQVGPLASGQTQIKALAHNTVNDKWYVISSDDFSSSAVLYTIDITSGELTEVGNLQNASAPVTLAIDCNGNAYIVNVEGTMTTTAVLYSLDLTTAAATQVGTNLGFDNATFFSQDMDFSPDDGSLYWSAYWSSGFFSEGGSYRIIDVSNGTSTEIGTFGQYETITGLSVNGNCPAVVQNGWQWINTGYDFILYDVSFPAGQSNIGYAVGSSVTYEGDGIILKTTDAGMTWNQISSGTIPGLEAVYFTSENVGYAAGWQDYFIKTTDGGITWNQINIDPGIWYFRDIEFTDANNGITSTADGTVYVTADAGNSWTLASGLNQDIQDLCYADASTLYAVGGDEKISKSTDGGFSWSEIYSGTFTGLLLGVYFTDANYGMVGGEDGKVLKTTDGGQTWITENAGGFALLHGVYIFNQDSAYVVGTPEQVYKTIDGGNTWTEDIVSNYNVAFYKVKFTSNNMGVICGSQGTILIKRDYVPVELTNFSALVNGASVSLKWQTASEINNKGFNIERKSDKSGWQEIGFVTGNGTSTRQHLYSFNDERLSEGTYNYRLKQIDFDGSFKYSNVVTAEISTPENFRLEQNYPNPFNPSTIVSYYVPVQSFVTLKVYNIAGEEVASLINGLQTKGHHTIIFDGKDFASGVYLVKMSAGNFSSIIKAVLLK
jgi:photosystem II stability/assembly factor-like uncharacterized protein